MVDDDPDIDELNNQTSLSFLTITLSAIETEQEIEQKIEANATNLVDLSLLFLFRLK